MRRGAQRMENRKPETGNRKRANVPRAKGVSVCHFPFPVSGFLFSILLCVAGVGRHVAAAAPPDTPVAAAPAPTPTPHVPQGFGKAKFGMTLEQVRQFYPTLAPAPA